MNLKQINFKQVGAQLLPVLILFVLSCAFFYPTLKGYDLRQGDMRSFAGMSQESQYFHEKTGEISWWNTAMFSGMPNTQIYGKYSGIWINHLRTALVNMGSVPIGTLFLYGLSFYIMLLVLGVRKWLSLIGAIAFAYSSYFIIIIEAGHVTKAIAISFVPLVLAGVFLLFQKRYWLGTAITSVAFALELNSNHVQITYYLLMFLLIFGIAKVIEAFKNKDLASVVKPTLLAIGSIFIALMCNFPTLFNTYEYGKITTRGPSNVTINVDGSSKEADQTSGLDRSYITNWSYGRQENLTFFIPNAVGGASGQIGDSKHIEAADPRFKQNVAQSNHYWGNQSFTSGPVYVGAGIFLLAILALVFVNGYFKWVLLIGSLLSMFLGMGKNMMWFTDLFLDFLPGYNKFRTVTMILILLELCVPILAILFLKKVIENGSEILKEKKKLLITSGVMALVMLGLWIMPESFLDFISDGEKQRFSAQSASSPEMGTTVQQFVDSLKAVRVSIFKADVLRSLMIMLVVFGAVYIFLIKKIKEAYFLLILGVVVLGDLWSVNRRYLNNDKQNGKYLYYEQSESNKYQFAPSNDDVQIFQNEMAQNPSFQQEIETEVKAKLAELSGKQTARTKELFAWNVRFGELNLKTNYRVFNLAVSPFNDASTSYYHKSIGGYHGAKLKRYQELIEFHIGGNINPEVLNMLNTKYIITQNGLQVNDKACGPAWFVDTLVKVADDNEEIQALNPAKFNAASMAVVSASQNVNVDVVPNSGTVTMTSFAPNKIVYSSSNAVDGLAVFSEIHYPMFWKAYIDGNEVPILRANFLLRALEIPKGQHSIEFVYDDSRIHNTEYVAYAGSLLLIILLAVSGFKAVKSKEEETV
tara:strand:- start:190022 stop:192625 length:2604 start_codon:yes stop_codon:yes gene_type:complete